MLKRKIDSLTVISLKNVYLINIFVKKILILVTYYNVYPYNNQICLFCS